MTRRTQSAQGTFSFLTSRALGPHKRVDPDPIVAFPCAFAVDGLPQRDKLSTRGDPLGDRVLVGDVLDALSLHLNDSQPNAGDLLPHMDRGLPAARRSPIVI